MSPDLGSDFLDPALMDWAAATDTVVYLAAKAGIGQAVAELARREAKA